MSLPDKSCRVQSSRLAVALPRLFAEFPASGASWQYNFLDQVADLKILKLDSLVTSFCHPQFLLFNVLQGLYAFVGYFIYVVHHQTVITLSRQIVLPSEPQSGQIYLY